MEHIDRFFPGDKALYSPSNQPKKCVKIIGKTQRDGTLIVQEILEAESMFDIWQMLCPKTSGQKIRGVRDEDLSPIPIPGLKYMQLISTSALDFVSDVTYISFSTFAYPGLRYLGIFLLFSQFAAFLVLDFKKARNIMVWVLFVDDLGVTLRAWWERKNFSFRLFRLVFDAILCDIWLPAMQVLCFALGSDHCTSSDAATAAYTRGNTAENAEETVTEKVAPPVITGSRGIYTLGLGWEAVVEVGSIGGSVRDTFKKGITSVWDWLCDLVRRGRTVIGAVIMGALCFCRGAAPAGDNEQPHKGREKFPSVPLVECFHFESLIVFDWLETACGSFGFVVGGGLLCMLVGPLDLLYLGCRLLAGLAKLEDQSVVNYELMGVPVAAKGNRKAKEGMITLEWYQTNGEEWKQELNGNKGANVPVPKRLDATYTIQLTFRETRFLQPAESTEEKKHPRKLLRSESSKRRIVELVDRQARRKRLDATEEEVNEEEEEEEENEEEIHEKEIKELEEQHKYEYIYSFPSTFIEMYADLFSVVREIGVCKVPSYLRLRLRHLRDEVVLFRWEDKGDFFKGVAYFFSELVLFRLLSLLMYLTVTVFILVATPVATVAFLVYCCVLLPPVYLMLVLGHTFLYVAEVFASLLTTVALLFYFWISFAVSVALVPSLMLFAASAVLVLQLALDAAVTSLYFGFVSTFVFMAVNFKLFGFPVVGSTFLSSARDADAAKDAAKRQGLRTFLRGVPAAIFADEYTEEAGEDIVTGPDILVSGENKEKSQEESIQAFNRALLSELAFETLPQVLLAVVNQSLVWKKGAVASGDLGFFLFQVVTSLLIIFKEGWPYAFSALGLPKNRYGTHNLADRRFYNAEKQPTLKEYVHRINNMDKHHLGELQVLTFHNRYLNLFFYSGCVMLFIGVIATILIGSALANVTMPLPLVAFLVTVNYLLYAGGILLVDTCLFKKASYKEAVEAAAATPKNRAGYPVHLGSSYYEGYPVHSGSSYYDSIFDLYYCGESCGPKDGGQCTHCTGLTKATGGIVPAESAILASNKKQLSVKALLPMSLMAVALFFAAIFVGLALEQQRPPDTMLALTPAVSSVLPQLPTSTPTAAPRALRHLRIAPIIAADAKTTVKLPASRDPSFDAVDRRLDSTTFSYALFSAQTYVVPANVITLLVTACGGLGGSNGGYNGGYGGYVESIVPVTPGATLKIYVGGSGANGGYNGGGYGREVSVSGGGATDIRLSDGTKLVVAGGGGGSDGATGGAGGGSTGQAGQSSSSNSNGGGGSQTAGGAGSTSYCSSGSGSIGQGGGCGSGGGGGGGYYGGGGGYYAGGGGSSNTISTGTLITSSQGDWRCNGDGSLTLTTISGPSSRPTPMPTATPIATPTRTPTSVPTFSPTKPTPRPTPAPSDAYKYLRFSFELAGLSMASLTDTIKAQITSSLAKSLGLDSSNVVDISLSAGNAAAMKGHSHRQLVSSVNAVAIVDVPTSAASATISSVLPSLATSLATNFLAASGISVSVLSVSQLVLAPTAATSPLPSSLPTPSPTAAPTVYDVVTVFGYTGGVQSYTVPAWVSALQVEACGGKGASANGGFILSAVPVSPGSTLEIYVGGSGASGGYNGGSAGSKKIGGNTDIRASNSTKLVVAAGGSAIGGSSYTVPTGLIIASSQGDGRCSGDGILAIKTLAVMPAFQSQILHAYPKNNAPLSLAWAASIFLIPAALALTYMIYQVLRLGGLGESEGEKAWPHKRKLWPFCFLLPALSLAMLLVVSCVQTTYATESASSLGLAFVVLGALGIGIFALLSMGAADTTSVLDFVVQSASAMTLASIFFKPVWLCLAVVVAGAGNFSPRSVAGGAIAVLVQSLVSFIISTAVAGGGAGGGAGATAILAEEPAIFSAFWDLFAIIQASVIIQLRDSLRITPPVLVLMPTIIFAGLLGAFLSTITYNDFATEAAPFARKSGSIAMTVAASYAQQTATGAASDFSNFQKMGGP